MSLLIWFNLIIILCLFSKKIPESVRCFFNLSFTPISTPEKNPTFFVSFQRMGGKKKMQKETNQRFWGNISNFLAKATAWDFFQQKEKAVEQLNTLRQNYLFCLLYIRYRCTFCATVCARRRQQYRRRRSWTRISARLSLVTKQFSGFQLGLKPKG